MLGAGVVYLGIISVFAGAISLVTPLSLLDIRTRLCADCVLALWLLFIVTGWTALVVSNRSRAICVTRE